MAKLAFENQGLNYEDYVTTSERYFRPNEVDFLLGDYSKAKSDLGWEPKTDINKLVDMMKVTGRGGDGGGQKTVREHKAFQQRNFHR